MAEEKEIRWLGSAYDDLVRFPDEPRRDAGFQLSKVQAGLEPEDWKPFDDVGTGTKEIRTRDISGIFRVMYVTKFEKRFTSCTVFRRKRRQPASKTRTLQRRVTAPWSTRERQKNDD